MFWLGLLLAVCYVPGYTGASVPTQWAVLAAILPLGLWRRSPWTIGHKLFLAFTAYALFMFDGAINVYSFGWGFFLIVIWGLSFHWGTLLDDLRPLWKGLAVGLYVSVAVAIAQALDYAPVEANEFQFAGLFYNSSLFGVICGLILVALASHRLWWYTPPLALGLVLSGSRGGLLIATIGLCARFISPLFACTALVAAAIGFSAVLDPTDSQRLQIWGVTLNDLSFLGQSTGSFTDLYFVRHTKLLLIHPEYVHNDYLQLAYEHGIGALALVAVFGLALVNTRSADWPVFFSWTVLAAFYFPLYAPLTAFIGLVVAGHLLRDRSILRDLSDRWRPYLLPWTARIERAFDYLRGQSVPVVTRTTSEEG